VNYLLNFLGVAIGIYVLVWSADFFVGGSAAFARRCGMSSLLIGIIIIGFGTSMPEMVVSVFAAAAHNPSIALGNAYGSNTANIGLILGLTAFLAPITVARSAWRNEIPLLIGVTIIGFFLLCDNHVITRVDAVIMLLVFAVAMIVNVLKGKRSFDETAADAEVKPVSLGKSIFMILVGLVFLIGSSRLLVWCSTRIARDLGVPDLIIGLTIVAVGTSLPELASSIAAVRKREHDIVLGNIIGSNLFNTLAVVGLACVITPMTEGNDKAAVHSVIVRDFPIVFAMTIVLWLVCVPFKRGGKAEIKQYEGAILLLSYLAYIGWLIRDALH
jgi:cation:H+ antiporter